MTRTSDEIESELNAKGFEYTECNRCVRWAICEVANSAGGCFIDQEMILGKPQAEPQLLYGWRMEDIDEPIRNL